MSSFASTIGLAISMASDSPSRRVTVTHKGRTYVVHASGIVTGGY